MYGLKPFKGPNKVQNQSNEITERLYREKHARACQLLIHNSKSLFASLKSLFASLKSLFASLRLANKDDTCK